MEEEQIQEKIEALRNAPCSYPDCGKKQFISCSVPYGFFTESGKLNFPMENKGSGMSLIIPLCAYHFPFAGRGIICMTDKGMVFPNFKGFTDAKTGELENVESYKDEEIEEMIKELQKKSRTTRGQEKKLFLGWVNIFQAIKEGRQFEKEMQQKGGLNSSQP